MDIFDGADDQILFVSMDDRRARPVPIEGYSAAPNAALAGRYPLFTMAPIAVEDRSRAVATGACESARA